MRSGEDQPQATFNQRGNGFTSPRRLRLDLPEQALIQSHCGPHMSQHTTKDIRMSPTLYQVWTCLGEAQAQSSCGRKVDLLTDGGISPYLRDRIYAEARAL